MKKTIAFLLILVLSINSFACTTFLLSKNGRHLFGRNYDWITENGMVIVNAKGVQKISARVADGSTLTWESLYGSVTFNQYGKEFPTGGMNEKGLVVELMWLDDTKYPEQDKRPTLNVLQWIQYQLDRSTTVDDVINSDTEIRISSTGTPLHYLIADASGNAATIEFLNRKMKVHKGAGLPFPVLANSTYKQSVERTKRAFEANETSYAEKWNSLQRFTTACKMVQNFQQFETNVAPVDYAFSILNSVSQGNATKWSIVYDITTRQVHFITNTYKDRKTFSFSDFNFSCSQQVKAFSMNQSGGGNIAGLFTPFTPEQNKELLQKSADESRSQVNIRQETIDEVVNLYSNQKCMR